MEIIVNGFILFMIVSLIVVVVSMSKKPELPIEQDEIDDQVESIRSGKSFWSDFTAKDIKYISVNLVLLVLGLWSLNYVINNREAIWVIIRQIFSF